MKNMSALLRTCSSSFFVAIWALAMYRPPPGDYSLFHAPGRRTQKGLQALQASAVQVTLHGLVWSRTESVVHLQI